MKKVFGLGLAALVLTASGCVGTQGSVDPDIPASGSVPTSQAPSSEPTEEVTSDEPTDEPTEAAVGKIGETFEWEDGISALVTAKMIKPESEYDDTAKDGKVLFVTVKLTNKTGERFDPTVAEVTVFYGKDGDQAEDAYVSEADEMFSGVIRNGKSQKAEYSYLLTAQQAQDLEIQVAPTWDHDPVSWLGGV